MKKKLVSLLLALTLVISSAMVCMAASTSNMYLGKTISKSVKSTTTTVYKLKLSRDTNVKFNYKTTSSYLKVAIYDSEDYFDRYRDFDDLEGLEYLSGGTYSKPKSSVDRYELDRGTYYIKVTSSKGKYSITASKCGYLKEFRTFTVNRIYNNSTSITGKGLAGATVKAYVNGKQIGKTTTVKSNGAYKITIPRQKSRAGVIVKMSKAGYETELEDRVVRAR